MGTSKNARLVIWREILFRVKVRKVQEYLMYFKLFTREIRGERSGKAPGGRFLEVPFRRKPLQPASTACLTNSTAGHIFQPELRTNRYGIIPFPDRSRSMRRFFHPFLLLASNQAHTSNLPLSGGWFWRAAYRLTFYRSRSLYFCYFSGPNASIRGIL